MDIIRITDLEVSYRVGVTVEERSRPQRLLLCLDLEYDLTPAIVRDSLPETVDYHAVSRWLLEFGEGRQWKLIETLAADIAATVLERFKLPAVTVEVKKFAIPEAASVSVQLRRTHKPLAKRRRKAE
jgi:FolB domain-containing protein